MMAFSPPHPDFPDLTFSQGQLLLAFRHYAERQEVLPELRQLAPRVGITCGGLRSVIQSLQKKRYLEIETFTIGGVLFAIARPKGCAHWTADPREPVRAKPVRKPSTNPVAQMVRRSFAEYEQQEPWRRAVKAISNTTFANAQARADARPTRAGVPCLRCGAAGACAHRPEGF